MAKRFLVFRFLKLGWPWKGLGIGGAMEKMCLNKLKILYSNIENRN